MRRERPLRHRAGCHLTRPEAGRMLDPPWPTTRCLSFDSRAPNRSHRGRSVSTLRTSAQLSDAVTAATIPASLRDRQLSKLTRSEAAL
jgi:hypothetical protein